MRLEAVIKHFSPKTVQISDSPPATKSDSLSITDIMAALGFAESKAAFGMSLFFGKNDVSDLDKVRAIGNLYQYAITQAGKHKAISRLENDIKISVLQTLAIYAYMDYSRSAASTRTCDCCHGDGFIDAEVFTMKQSQPFVMPQWAKDKGDCPGRFTRRREIKETVRLLCPICKGKKVISNACRCNGRGKVVDQEKTEAMGIPVMKTCSKCGGNGYSRLKFAEVYEAIKRFIPDLASSTCYESFKPFFELLVTKCLQEESSAEAVFNTVTR